jgi:hypothetical protein
MTEFKSTKKPLNLIIKMRHGSNEREEIFLRRFSNLDIEWMDVPSIREVSTLKNEIKKGEWKLKIKTPFSSHMVVCGKCYNKFKTTNQRAYLLYRWRDTFDN